MVRNKLRDAGNYEQKGFRWAPMNTNNEHRLSKFVYFINCYSVSLWNMIGNIFLNWAAFLACISINQKKKNSWFETVNPEEK